MATRPSPGMSDLATLVRGFKVQARVVGALVMRELHTRYGRENVGYLWMIGEPLLLASAIAVLHTGGTGSHYGSDIRPMPFAVMGYCIFIIFRGIFNRAEGALEVNMALLYHKMVTIFDIMVSRAVLEGTGVFLCFVVIMTLLTSLGAADPPERPLWLVLGIGFMIWWSFALSLTVVSISHDNRLIGRMIHPFSYLMMPLSGSFFALKWIPMPYQDYLWWFPMVQIFELCRYGYFRAASDEFVNLTYMTGACLILTYIGLVQIKLVRGRIHLH